MPYAFSNVESADIVYTYGEARGSGDAARRLYAQRFPMRRTPTSITFKNIFQRLRNTGSTALIREGTRHSWTLGDQPRTRRILQHFNGHPDTSTRRASSALNLSRTTIHSTLKANKLHPFHITKVQNLLPTDLPKRRAFCDWILDRHDGDENFLRKILWTDEATFTRHGIFNQRNTHIWARENPHAMREHNFQHNFQCNVWMGIVDNVLVGPHFLPDRLNSEGFLDFLENDLELLLGENVPLQTRQQLWFQMDGCPAHFGRGPRQWIQDHFENCWIGRGGPVAWPPRSPDFTPLDFFLWGTLKELVYATPVNDLQTLKERIVECSRLITPAMCRAATQAVTARATACLQENGWQFEQLNL